MATFPKQIASCEDKDFKPNDSFKFFKDGRLYKGDAYLSRFSVDYVFFSLRGTILIVLKSERVRLVEERGFCCVDSFFPQTSFRDASFLWNHPSKWNYDENAEEPDHVYIVFEFSSDMLSTSSTEFAEQRKSIRDDSQKPKNFLVGQEICPFSYDPTVFLTLKPANSEEYVKFGSNGTIECSTFSIEWDEEASNWKLCLNPIELQPQTERDGQFLERLGAENYASNTDLLFSQATRDELSWDNPPVDSSESAWDEPSDPVGPSSWDEPSDPVDASYCSDPSDEC